jgi:hypothetical protein
MLLDDHSMKQRSQRIEEALATSPLPAAKTRPTEKRTYPATVEVTKREHPFQSLSVVIMKKKNDVDQLLSSSKLPKHCRNHGNINTLPLWREPTQRLTKCHLQPLESLSEAIGQKGNAVCAFLSSAKLPMHCKSRRDTPSFFTVAASLLARIVFVGNLQLSLQAAYIFCAFCARSICR